MTTKTSMVRFEHHVLVDGSHVITSPDLKGLHVSARDRPEAERKAIEVARLMMRLNDQHGHNLAGVTFEAA